MGVNSIQNPTKSTNPVHGEQVYVPGPKHLEGPPQTDTIESAAPGSTTAAETKWTPPSQCARCWMCVKHRIADFLDWVCSFFCSSKAATKEQKEAAEKEFDALLVKFNTKELLAKRYEKVIAPSKNDAYCCLADYIEGEELVSKLMPIMFRWRPGAVLTERQLRSEKRQAIEIATSVGIFAHSNLPREATEAMKEKVEAYSLGKLTIAIGGKTISLFDEKDLSTFPDKLEDLANELIDGIRDPILEEFAPQLTPLKTPVAERYKKVTLQDLGDESQAVRVLADCIEVMEVYNPLIKDQGNISKESLGKRIEMLEKRLGPEQPVLGKETPEMRKRVKEYDFSLKEDEHGIIYKIGSTEQSEIRSRLREVISAVQKPQEAQIDVTS